MGRGALRPSMANDGADERRRPGSPVKDDFEVDVEEAAVDDAAQCSACPKLKAEYQRCFDAWFQEQFLTGRAVKLACVEE